MISAGEGWVWRHRTGRYFVSHWHHPCIPGTACHDPNQQAEISYSLTRNPYAATLIYNAEWWGEKWLEREPSWRLTADQFEVVPGPGCACCGERGWAIWGHRNNWRCDKHRDRNPCANCAASLTALSPRTARRAAPGRPNMSAHSSGAAIATWTGRDNSARYAINLRCGDLSPRPSTWRIGNRSPQPPRNTDDD